MFRLFQALFSLHRNSSPIIALQPLIIIMIITSCSSFAASINTDKLLHGFSGSSALGSVRSQTGHSGLELLVIVVSLEGTNLWKMNIRMR